MCTSWCEHLWILSCREFAVNNLAEQLKHLEEKFELQQYPGILVRENLAREVYIEEGRIHVRWLITFFFLIIIVLLPDQQDQLLAEWNTLKIPHKKYHSSLC